MIGKVSTLAAAMGLVAIAPAVGLGRVEAQERPRVAVIAFKNPTSWWGRELGASAASQLTTRLVNGGAFSVMERDRVKDVFDEWYLGQTGSVDKSQAAQMGKLNGVEYLITGEFRSFNIRQRRAGIGPLAVSQMVAESSINVRAISVTTGEVVAAAESSGNKILGQGARFRGTGYSSVTTNSPWNPTLAEDALGEALDTIATTLASQRSRFPTTSTAAASGAEPAQAAGPAIAGFATDGSVYIDQGENAGITVGRRFHVLRVVDVIRDAQGNELDKVTKRVGVIEVTQVLSRSAICRIVEGKPEPKDLLEPN